MLTYGAYCHLKLCKSCETPTCDTRSVSQQCFSMMAVMHPSEIAADLQVVFSGASPTAMATFGQLDHIYQVSKGVSIRIANIILGCLYTLMPLEKRLGYDPGILRLCSVNCTLFTLMRTHFHRNKLPAPTDHTFWSWTSCGSFIVLL